ncbi:hypothetical protein [Mycobacterium sp.]|uniref:hypothetical protein n=1 Tax=Mycobacterium sp. TaxID=1785 RepID=UPI003C75EFAA
MVAENNEPFDLTEIMHETDVVDTSGNILTIFGGLDQDRSGRWHEHVEPERWNNLKIMVEAPGACLCLYPNQAQALADRLLQCVAELREEYPAAFGD